MVDKNNIIRHFEQVFAEKAKYEWTHEEYSAIIEYYFFLNFDKAKSLFAIRQAITDFPNDYGFNLIIAKYYIKAKKYDKALKIVEREDFFKNSYVEDEVTLLRAEIYYAVGKYDLALSWFERAYNDIGDITLVYNISHCFMQIRDYQSAVTYLKDYIKAVPDADYAYFDLSKCWEKLSAYDVAIDYFENIIFKHDSFSSAAWFALALNYLNKGWFEKAESAFLYTIAINPESSSSYFNLGNIYSQKSKYEKAVEMYKKSISIEGEQYLTDLYIGECYYFIGDFSEALKYLKKCIKINKDCAEAYYWFAQIYYCSFEQKKALKYIDMAITIDQQQADYHALKGNINALLGLYDSAEESYISSLTIRPSHVDNITDLTNFYLSCNRPQKAIPYIAIAIQNKPDESRFYYLLSLCEFYEGNLQEAYAQLTIAVSIDRDFLTEIENMYPDFIKDTNIQLIINDKH